MKVGLLGGGQLAQMLAQAGSHLGMTFRFISPDPQACAAPFGEHIYADYHDTQAFEQLAEWADVITYESENIPGAVANALEKIATFLPSAKALRIAGDRLLEKQLFNTLNIPTVAFEDVSSVETLHLAVEKIGLPAILKTRKEGYDGKGQVVLRDKNQTEAAWNSLGQTPCILEEMVNFSREVSIIAVRNKQGHCEFYPLTENHHRDGILRLSLCLKSDPYQQQAETLIKKLLKKLDYVGVLTLELFQVGETLMANEMAPRVHNSGHWTIEGSEVSQFENHLRAVCGLPLGYTKKVKASAMLNLIGTLPSEDEISAFADTYFHDYGKSEKPGRKLGHITMTCYDNKPDSFDHTLKKLIQIVDRQDLIT
jgi:5-(carboxyamino)imidazole ribonucleotide synthase